VRVLPIYQEVYRIAREPDPWEAPDWAYSGDGPPVNRYDDPQKTYRVVYASSSPYGCFLETLSRYRLDPKIYAEYPQIQNADDGIGMPLGVVPRSWFHGRALGVATLSGNLLDVSHSETIGWLNIELAGLLADLKLGALDGATLRLTTPRAITQAVSFLAFSHGLDGVMYPSKHGDDVLNFAIFEPFATIHTPRRDGGFDSDNTELHRALDTLRLRLQTPQEAAQF
jgi:hypothetical protein